MSRIYKLKIQVINYNMQTMRQALDLISQLESYKVEYGEFLVYVEGGTRVINGARVIGEFYATIDLANGDLYVEDYDIIKAKEKIDQYYTAASFIQTLESQGYQLSNIYINPSGEIEVEMEEITI